MVLRSGILGCVLLAALPSALPSQQRLLDAADSHLASGEYAEARAAVERWWREVAGDGSSDPRARPRALLLRARLTADFDSAEKDFLAVVLGHPTSPQAPEALLRLGQGLVAHSDPQRAAAYLERLVADYPGAEQRPAGQLWLAKARAATGRSDAACAAARAAVAAAAGASESAAQAAAHAAEFCGDPEIMAIAQAASAAGRYAVQVGAFRERARAERLAASLRGAEQDPRIITVPGSGLIRVRIGRFDDAASAMALHDRLRALGHEVVVVADADRERAP